MSLNEKVTNIIVDKLSVEESRVVPEASFLDDLGADSLDTVELIMEFEEEFDLEIPDEDTIYWFLVQKNTNNIIAKGYGIITEKELEIINSY